MTKSDHSDAADFAQFSRSENQRKPALNIMYPDEPQSLSLLLSFICMKMHGNWADFMQFQFSRK